ncbi:MAG: SanA/YdcF family protein [Chthoniobacterales bacterium]
MKWRRLVCALVTFSAAFLIASNLWIEIQAAGRIYSNLLDVPVANVGLVLGTSRLVHGGYENPFFAGRISAAAELYHSKRVRHLLLSGDNHIAGYDEPSDMRDALIEQGVPQDAMTLDYAGFRTLDSFARAKKVFGLSHLTIVTDDFHAARAVLLARHFRIDARAYISPPVPLKWSIKTRLRELGARCKAVLDLYVLRTKPHFLGPPIPLPID